MWIPLAVVFILYIFFRRYLALLEMRTKFEAERYHMARQRDSASSGVDEIARLRDILPKMLESIIEDRNHRTLREIENIVERGFAYGLRNQFNELSSSLNQNLDSRLNKTLLLAAAQPRDQVGDRSGQLIREISHSLNTPIALIESSILTLGANNQTHDGDSMFSQTIDSIQTSLNICKSVLAAYRELVLVATSATLWSPESVSDAIESASKVYVKNSGKSLRVHVDMPTSIKGYSNNYVVSLLLPLIENAVDASPEGAQLSVRGRVGERNFNVEIENATNAPPQSDQIYENGFTTKDKHEGTGLSVVQYLLSAQRGASISHVSTDDSVVFKIVLPIGD
jgi:K+-sensing histidine kinase KdpD